MKVLEGHRAHLAHLQFHAYGGDDWHTMRSEAAQLAEYFNAHDNLTTDAGAVLFGNAVTITADGPWQHLLLPAHRDASGATWTSRTRPAAGSSPTSTRRATWSTRCSGPWAWSCCC